MKLTKKEKDILTLMDETPVKNFVGYAKRFVNYPKNEIIKIKNKLIKQKYVEIIILPTKIKKWYFHTQKVNKDMLNNDIRWKKDFKQHFGKEFLENENVEY